MLVKCTLPHAPQNPGLLLIDARGPLEHLLPSPDPSAAAGPGPAFVMSCRAVPVVAISNPAVAAELQAAVESWDGGESELDDLLLDLGTWAHHVSMQAGMLLALAAVGGDGAVGGGGGIWGGGAAAGAATAAAAAALPAIDTRLASLGRHLLAYAEASGWAVTASALRVGGRHEALCAVQQFRARTAVLRLSGDDQYGATE